MISYTYSKGTEINHSWAKDEAEFNRVKKQKESDGWKVSILGDIRSGSHCKCFHCGFVGVAYGMIVGNFTTPPFCSNCGMNNQLLVVTRIK